MELAEDRIQKREDRCQMAEDRAQRTDNQIIEANMSLRGSETTEAIPPAQKLFGVSWGISPQSPQPTFSRGRNERGGQKDASNMERVNINLGVRGYPVLIGEKLLSKTGALLNDYEISKKVAVISNPTVWKFYGKQVIKSLKDAGFSPVKIIIPDGERYKNLKTVEKIYTGMLKAGIDRKGCVIALGGGVVGDIAGFVSATYMRGVKYVQIPTTLLAQVDASIVGKTGGDHKLGKNLIGAFYQPLFVLSDISTLKTLPEREFRAGLAEIIKYGIIRDAELFDFLEKNASRILIRDREALEFIIRRSCEIKARIVEQDEREETGLRSILNFGHTIGHAIEAATKYRKYLHGEAVAMGMVAEAELSGVLGYASGEEIEKVRRIVGGYFERSLEDELLKKKLLTYIKLDKKKAGELIKIPLILSIGNVDVKKIDLKKLLFVIRRKR